MENFFQEVLMRSQAMLHQLLPVSVLLEAFAAIVIYVKAAFFFFHIDTVMQTSWMSSADWTLGHDMASLRLRRVQGGGVPGLKAIQWIAPHRPIKLCKQKCTKGMQVCMSCEACAECLDRQVKIP